MRHRFRFRPSASPLEGRSLLTTVFRPGVVGPPADAGHSGAQMTVSGGFAVLTGSDLGDAIAASPIGASTVEVQVSNSQGTDAFVIPASDVLEINAGSGANSFVSTASDTTIFIGGMSDNVARGGSGFTFLVSTGGGANDFTAGSGYSVFVASSAGTTVMHGGGVFNSASLCNGVDTFDAAAPAVVYTYGFSVDTVTADASDPLDVYVVGSFEPTVNNPDGNPGVTVHHGFA